MKKTLIVSATKSSSKETTPLWKSLQNHISNENVDIKFVTNNKTGLCKIYNTFINAPYETIIFAHDDITIDSVNFLQRIQKSLESYDVVGVAGGGNPNNFGSINKTNHILWHLMTDKNKGEQSGIVFHPHIPWNCNIPSIFGPRPKEVILLDGLFLAINAPKIQQKGVKFDENITGFHHYDIKFCLDCYLNNLKLSTSDINICHESPGLKSFTNDFLQSQDYVRSFLQSITI